MGRLSLYLVGIYGLAAAYLVYLNRREQVRAADRGPAEGRIPVTRAAEMLREAWADHHTAV